MSKLLAQDLVQGLASLTIKILYFAWLRERVGVAEEDLMPPDDIATVEALVEWLSSRDSKHELAFRNRSTIRCAVNQEFCESSSPVRSGDEVAFFPPVTGG